MLNHQKHHLARRSINPTSFQAETIVKNTMIMSDVDALDDGAQVDLQIHYFKESYDIRSTWPLSKSANKAPVWDYFGLYSLGRYAMYAVCLLCRGEVCRGTKGNTYQCCSIQLFE
jgi:hypothetical protein